MEFKELPYQVNGKIVMIPRGCLKPHPDNPRKDLGDLEELSASIKEHGIMQNLTVVPINDDLTEFHILIGHRRFAASEGIINTLPCVIASELSPKEQVGVMLCENMQRTDLTYIEQAHGFQMMMDLGDEIKDITKKTGFSASTIKHRLAIAELDEKLIKKVSEENNWQLTIKDFVELEKITDIEDREEVLADSMDSQDLAINVEDYLRKKHIEENYKKLEELFEELGFEESENKYVAYNSNYNQLIQGGISLDSDPDTNRIRMLAEKTKDPIYYARPYSQNVYLVTKVKKTAKKEEKKTPEQLEREKKERNIKAIEDMRGEICDEYYNCIEKIDNMELFKMEYRDQTDLIRTLWELLEKSGTSIIYRFSFRDVVGDKKDLEDLEHIYKGLPVIKRMMFQVWRFLAEKYSNKLTEWDGSADFDVLDIHRTFIDDVLYHFGLRLEDELDRLLLGDSELYAHKINIEEEDEEDDLDD